MFNLSRATCRAIWGGLVLVTFLAAAFGTASFLRVGLNARNRSNADKARALGNPIPVRTLKVQYQQSEKVIGGTSLTGPSKTAHIGLYASRTTVIGGAMTTPTGAVVKRVLVKHGDFVKSGQVIMELDDSHFTTSLKALEAVHAAAVNDVDYREKALAMYQEIRKLNLERAKAEVVYRQTDVRTRTKIREALENLSKTGAASIISTYEALSKLTEAEFNETAARLDVLRTETSLTVGYLSNMFDLIEAKSKREQAAAGMELVRDSIEACLLKSPLEGFVNTVNIVAGDAIDMRSPTAVTEVLQLDPLWVAMDYPQERISELSVGLDTEVIVDSHPRESFKGKVISFLPMVRPTSRTVPVYIEVPNPGNRILAGISGFCRVSVATRKTIVVPTTALIQDKSKAMVFCVVDGKVQSRSVVPGHVVENGNWEVLEGLSPDDEVVIFGNKDLREGDVVDTDWRHWSGRE